MTSAPPVKKACDACHRRKVRCSGGQPCKNCGQASLQCTYLAIPQKKGPKGSRAKVISEIRDTQQQQKQNLQKAAAHPPTPTTASRDAEHNPFDFNTPPISPTAHVRNLDLLSTQTVENCIDFFFDHLYPTMPIFSRQHLNNLAAEYRNGPPEVYCLVLSLCAFIMVQPGMSFEGMPMPASYDQDPVAARYRLASLLLKEIHRIRKNIDYVDNPTIHSVQISFFLFCSYFGLDKTNTCWYHLRESSTLAHMLSMNEESSYKVGDPSQNIYSRRFYWLVLVTERANALQRHKPLSMLATIDLPTVDSNSAEAPVLHGFVYLASLFRLIDDEFMALWNKAKSECSTSYLSQLQSQLADVIPPVLECTENQAADVKITQHWLRCMVWQLSITNGYLSSTSPDMAMSFKYPIEIARDLIRDITKLSLQSMEVHGVGLVSSTKPNCEIPSLILVQIEKLFDMSCTLSDVITYVPFEPANGDTQTPQDYLNQLLNLISRLRGGASRYVPLLMAKVGENLPNMSNPLAHMPHTLDAFVEGSASTGSSPQEMIKQQPNMRHPSQQQAHVSSSAQSSPFPGLHRQHSYSDSVQTPQAQHTPQQERLMFESYSPSGKSHSEPGMTPPLYGTPQQQYAHHPSNQHPLPRSIPLGPPDMKQEVWDGYHV